MSELQIKTQQLKAQTPTPSGGIYTAAKSSMHTWENAVYISNLPGRGRMAIPLALLFFYHSITYNLWHMLSHFPLCFLLSTMKSLGKVTDLVFFALIFFFNSKNIGQISTNLL